MRASPRTARAVALALVLWTGLSSACTVPAHPGDDLPDPAPEAELGALVNSAMVGGEYLASATLTLALTGMVIPASYLLVATQEGFIPDGDATVQVELRDPMQPDMPGPTLEEPAPITVIGTFRAEYRGVVIPKETFGGMFSSDGVADITIAAEILSADCMIGELTLSLTSPVAIALSGPFTAPREGTSGCDAAMSPTPTTPEEE